MDRTAPPRHGSVLVFDSGIGGLNVLGAIRALLPQRHLVYVADDNGFPYGEWPDGALRRHLLELIGRLLAAHRPSVVVIACNTAATLALADLRTAYHGIAFVGTVPAVKPAAQQTRSGLISVLATAATVRQPCIRELIGAHAAHREVRLVGSHRLADLAESHARSQTVTEKIVRAEIAPCFVERGDRRTDTVVLACTHYPFLLDMLRRLAPWPVDWVDPAMAIARRVQAVSASPAHGEAGASYPGHATAFLTAGPPDPATARLLHRFGLTPSTHAARAGSGAAGSLGT